MSAGPPVIPVRWLRNLRLWVVAATAVTHGAFAGEPIVRPDGPELPADTDAKMPASRAPRNACPLVLVHALLEPPPIEKLITSTPSAVAWSIACVVSALRQPAAVHALYVIRFACGATPESFRVMSIVGACSTAAGVTLPTAVLAVWLPCSLSSSGD